MWLEHVVQRQLTRRAEAVALRDQRRQVSWRELDEDVAALAAVFAEQVPPGGRVLIHSANRVEVLETYLACAAAGVVAVPVNPSLADPELAHIITQVEPALAMADTAGGERLRAGHPQLPVQSVADIPGLPRARPPRTADDLSAPVAVLHTSATTGRPKGVVVDQRSLQLNAFSWLADVGVAPGTVFLNAGPLFHGSMVIALDYLAAGATVCVLDRFTPQECLARLQEWQVEHAFLVPAMVRLVLEAGALKHTDLNAWELLLHGAAPMPAELAEEAGQRLGVRLQTIFGITEGGGPVVSLRSDDKPTAPPIPGATCIGVPMLGTQAQLRDENGAAVTAAGEVGEIHLTGDGLMHGYWRNDDATAQVLRDGWLNTKDMGCFDDAGLLWVVDRRLDLILRGGQNIYPAEIEHVLRSVPSVAEAVVVPAPSRTWGQIPVAFIRPAPGAQFDEGELIAHCVTSLAAYKRPGRFLPVQEIPRNPAGKVLRAELRQRAEETADKEN